MYNWFKHDATAHADAKLMQLLQKDKKWYANYWLTLEWLYLMADASAKEIEMNSLPYFLHETKEETDAFISFCIGLDLFTVEGNIFYSKRLLEQKEKQMEKTAKARAKANKRWGKKNATAMPQHTVTDAEENRIEENTNNADSVSATLLEPQSTIGKADAVSAPTPSSENPLSESVTKIFDEYERISSRAIRKRSIYREAAKSALKDFTIEEIRQAFAAMQHDKNLTGNNEQNKNYFTIEYGLRKKKIEHYLNIFLEQS